MKTPVSISDVQTAMAWFRSLSETQKLHHRKNIDRNDAISITRYWVEKNQDGHLTVATIRNIILIHASSYSEYTLNLGRWVYRRTVDYSAVCLQ